MKRTLFLFMMTLLSVGIAVAQETFPRNDVKDDRARAYAFTNATIYINSTTKLENATLLVRDGKVEKSGAGLAVPAGYTMVDLKGKFIYPSFIDLYTNYGLPKAEGPLARGGGGFGGQEQIDSKTKGAYNGNESIKSEYNASDEFTADDKTAEKFRAGGYGAVLTFRADGLARGTGAVVTVGDDRDNVLMLKDQASAHYAFNRGTSRQSYPVSLMGFIALLRQTYMDADWYSKQPVKPFKNLSLESWIATQNLPQFFDAGSWINDLRADKLGDEFKVQYIIRGGGDEYQRIAEIKATNASLLIPINFPEAYDVEDPFDAERTSLQEMKHWELAPTNPAALEKAGIEFAITSDRLKERTDLLKNLRKAIQYGLSEATALKSITETPAKLLGMQSRIGSLSNGREANFIITSGSLFNEETVIYQNWVQGKSYSIKDIDEPDYTGKYNLSVNGKSYTMEVSGKPGSHAFKIKLTDSLSVDGKSKLEKNLITLSFNLNKNGDESARLTGWRQGNGWTGKGQLKDGTWTDWKADLTGPLDKKDEKKDAKKPTTPTVGDVIYPFTAFGSKEKVKQEEILIKNATVWTNEKEGILQNTDVLLKGGKISAIGKKLTTTGRTIDGTGKHLTAGIIDEHSHIAAAAINDANANSSMVRIGDVVDSEAISIYRTLSGGVTALQILHGSANPIGGQSAIIKLKWGSSPEELKIAGADGFIKFALGENVKRTSNSASIRFPQTRMGVEQVYVDAFTNALEYEKKWKEYNALKVKTASMSPRRDLVDETMLEIIRGKRFVTCHSYVQSEINMMMKVADRFGFHINTFTHILEGYKVADKMKAHGVGGSTFSDWWDYKWEVHYAIPYNASIMNREGVVTAINSDDAEMGRRLNQEAAKAVRYGGTSEEDAIKMVTLNPAKLLHLDNTMGSIKVGKSADVTLWTDHPLSIYAKADKTIVDGSVYFDLEKDQKLRKELEAERARLIAKMLEEKKGGSPTQRSPGRVRQEFHCEDFVLLEEETEQR